MYFAQQETQVQVTSTSNITDLLSVNLTGFRAGEVKSIVLWLTTAANSTPGNGNYDPLRWQPINGVTLTYNGEIFSRFDVGSAALWNLTCDEKTQTLPAYNYQVSGSVSSATQATPWVDCPFAQVCVPYDKEMKLIHGKPILNAVVNLQFQAPVASTAYVLHAMYLYNASLLCSRGSAEYIF
jgi:hypothetical protein